jgi:hypothetical protein
MPKLGRISLNAGAVEEPSTRYARLHRRLKLFCSNAARRYSRMQELPASHWGIVPRIPYRMICAVKREYPHSNSIINMLWRGIIFIG